MHKLILSVLLVSFTLFSCKKEEKTGHIPVSGLQTISSQSQLTTQVSSGVSFIFFHASWCSICNAMRPAVTSTAEDTDLAGVYFGEVEYDDHPDIISANNVPGFPTILIFKDGVQVDQIVGGGHSYADLKAAVQAQL